MSQVQKIKAESIWIISDTHNLVRPEAVEILKNSDLIIHAGDICCLNVLEKLRTLAPVIAVRGNNDKGQWADDIPVYKLVEINGILIFVIHDIKELKMYPVPSEVKVIISGHSHKPSLKEQNDILYLNPGSAGPKRFSLPVSVAKLQISAKDTKAEIIPLLV